jgi:hypothetical protein
VLAEGPGVFFGAIDVSVGEVCAEIVGVFLDRAPLTDSIANLEEALEGSTQAQVDSLLDAMTVRAPDQRCDSCDGNRALAPGIASAGRGNSPPLAIAIDGHGRVLVTGGETAPYTRGRRNPAMKTSLPAASSSTVGAAAPSVKAAVAHRPAWLPEPRPRRLTQPNGKVVAGGWVQIERFGGTGPATRR